MVIISAPEGTKPAGTGRRLRRVALNVLIWLLIVPGLLWAIVRLGGVERGPLVQLMAFTAYVAGWSVLPAVLALATRRWAPGGLAVTVVLVFAVLVLPRALPGDRGPAAGVPLRVMTSNMLFGRADPQAITTLVRDNDVAVLALQEFTTEGRAALTAAGIDELLPYHSFGDEPGASGSGLYSRFPISEGGVRRNNGGFRQAYGTIRPPGAGPLLMESAHPRAPSEIGLNPIWRDDLAAQPSTGAGTPRILLGDFNATLDHAALRELIGRGYRDAADATGQGLTPTWPFLAHPGIPRVTIDHVLVDRRIGVRETQVHPIAGSDHRAVVALLTVPVI